ncbi:Metallo-dependent phosphatase [Melanomma pulvis-pyrius CBS 109.77]|uniref:Metallo-dependent phosphatase n=1 Tax=Melanomma pulvis-pyrius CBS 109.77 TaxID=1314802 RepID=A0A6A6XSF7_9PLEO|nr:Metallo-dependent phosphatase [Melanomma pulvis-pyrius CBS 109.77]
MSVRTRFLIMSDTHNQWPYSDCDKAPKVDVLLHCGDLTQVSGLPSFRKAIANIKTIDAELKLVIAGNHDLELDEDWTRDNMEGGDDLEDSTHTFTLFPGVHFIVYASPYTPEFNGYAFAYSSEDRFNDGLDPIPDTVDIIMTHGPPIFKSSAYQLDINDKDGHYGCDKLAKAVRRSKPTLHCFGHLHEGRGRYSPVNITLLKDDGTALEVNPLLTIKETLLVNAAMRDGQGQERVVVLGL